MGASLYRQVRTLSTEQREKWVNSLPMHLAGSIAQRPWWFVGRPEQQPPTTDWNVWLILSGRGWGKTRTGSEWIIEEVLNNPKAPDGTPTEFAIIAETFGDCRVMCVEGPSGVLRVLERRGLVNGVHFNYNRSSWQITFDKGQKIHMFGADNPDAGRGYNLAGVWADEIAKWRYSYETWYEGILPALRIGRHPRAVITTTPKPIRILRDWTGRTDGSVFVTRGSTFDNADNLSAIALQELRVRYEGTRLGRQELYGELLEDIEGALWTNAMIEPFRVSETPEFARVIVSVDPATTSGENSDETGIVVVAKGVDGRGYVLADYSCRESVFEWAKIVINAYDKFNADRVVTEKNQGGDAWGDILHQLRPTLPFTGINAKRGKRLRAEPVSALYEQGRVSHVGTFPDLETQMTSWVDGVSDISPDRLDALVHGMTALNIGTGAGAADRYFEQVAPPCPECGTPNGHDALSCFQCGTGLQVVSSSTRLTPAGFPQLY